ncbi:MAG TPA: nucleotide sugar dehydrogenase [Candidatus Limnocylindrales bacterium]|nr:nucleotide sugar dehydrogenase [Candidatus Limnocylindrales bacterium]
MEYWKVGLVGLGKLGMPVALAMSMKGHDVMGYDIDTGKMQKEQFPHREAGPNGEPSIEPLLRKSSLRFGSLKEVVRHADIIFLAVQTPHDPRYEGVTRLPKERMDFDYSYLKNAMRSLAMAIKENGKDKIVVIISTVLPGTIRGEILPLINDYVKLCYNPFFIAMGSTITDFLNPEFVLFGVRDKEAAERAKQFYRTLHNKPFYETTIENAELIKVVYNTYITMKICYANTLMEICHKIPGCNVDVVTNALALATDRLISSRYLRGGMGDGGGCHPRDNIALSWLARELNLSYDWFEHVMICRERQTEWLADLIEDHHRRRGYPHHLVGIYGRSFKAGTNLTVGSPATLLANILEERGFEVCMYDPYIDAGSCPFRWSGVYFIATNHKEFSEPDWHFPPRSVIIDPWRYIPKREGVEIIPVGINENNF